MSVEIDEIDPARLRPLAQPPAVAADQTSCADDRTDGPGSSARSGPVGSFQYEQVKRAVDIALALFLGLLSIPLIALLSAYIALESGRPIFISQQRVGRWGRKFRLLKFRTLPRQALKSSDRDWFVDADSRIMKLVRRVGLDELPQFLNVLRGEMSLIGPRPERPYFARRFERDHPDYSLRYQLLPGMTGWAQVTGWRGNTSIRRRLEHDLYYLDHWTPAFDLRILLSTVTTAFRNVASPRGEG